ncbi:hypothetical protein [Hyphomicrobium sp.]|uniref:hypothetical protein n=1 Tax=Hyphomicrobium sp. TaxID=82 RepID=UPI002E365BB8|nr:hypothetical protein [Hyphomicrobium sp.]HEX2843057.1 hypothetical protein [Hyphomicrobium sp.]
MQQKIPDPRIHSMFSGDRLWAFGAVLVLWCTYAFVFSRILLAPSTDGVIQALAVAGGLVLLFNTASIFAMIKHYSEDKEHIYGLDIHYLDEMKKSKESR